MRPTKLEPGFPADRCPACEGTWIPAEGYRRWRERQPGDLPEQTEGTAALDVNDTRTAKICPACGHILLRYQVGHGIPFILEHCGQCNGVWCDRNEWETLKERGLHDNLHQMFAGTWQRQVRQEERRAALDRRYTERFGKADFEELQRLKAWISGHPLQAEILAYLNDPDPYEA
ncbi:MAG: zf-TFIIB domain-containing protein [Armatimonadetes bacterium]|nr:zf-TFIIB domain-containing protein [Armatimonadota bacterium]